MMGSSGPPSGGTGLGSTTTYSETSPGYADNISRPPPHSVHSMGPPRRCADSSHVITFINWRAAISGDI